MATADSSHPARLGVRGLSKSYGGHRAVSDLTFEVAPGEVVGFLGPNGAGKSTTMRALGGLLRADRGEAWVGDISLAADPKGAQRVLGYMPENNPLPEELRVGEYLRFRARLKGLGGKRLRERVGTVLELCDLAKNKAHRRIIGQLSKGFRQRVGLAEALLAQPRAILLDEPTIGLDPHQVILIRDLLQRLRGQTTVLLSSHILSEVEQACDRVIIIRHGRMVGQGTLMELRQEFAARPHFALKIKGDPTIWQTALASLDTDWDWKEQGDAGDGFTLWKGETTDETLRGERLLPILTQLDGVTVRSLARREPTLEEIFLRATHRSWEAQLPLKEKKPSAPASKPPVEAVSEGEDVTDKEATS